LIKKNIYKTQIREFNSIQMILMHIFAVVKGICQQIKENIYKKPLCLCQ